MTQSEQIRDFLLTQVMAHPTDLVRYTAETFGISRQAVNRHLKKLVTQGAIGASGTTKSRRYKLALSSEVRLEIDLTRPVEEHEVWRTALLPNLTRVPENAMRIAEYAFTEILNNAIDHSAGTEVEIRLELSPASIHIVVADNGIGIFKKLQTEFQLADERQAVLELAKGKVTTDPRRHTGEGIFFTSRAVEQFGILAGNLYFGHLRDTEDWLLENTDEEATGTSVDLLIDPNTERSLQAVFARYTAAEDEYGFTKTVVPVSLLRYGIENLVSRSQAKRLLARFDRFKEVVLDFEGVEVIGHAFADEIFRVFRNAHPDVNIRWMRANPEVERMILRAYTNVDQAQLELLDFSRENRE